MCESCGNYSNEVCIEFFAVWNIIWGLFFFMSCFVGVCELQFDEPGNTIFYHVVFYVGCIFGALYALSGVFVLLGDWKDSAFMFYCGLILSNPLPIWAIPSVFIPIVHVVALIRLIKLARLRWK